MARGTGTQGAITASLAVTAPTPGSICLNYTFFNEGDLGFSGTPVAGETWTVFVDGHPISTVSSAGESLAQVISSLAAQIPGIPPYDYLFSAGLGDLYVQHGFWLFFGYSFISLGGTVTLNPGQIYGSISVVNSAPVGVNIALNAPSGGPASGETWTLTLDGTKYAYAYNGTGGLNAIASALAGLIPQSVATAHGGPYYSVGVSGSSIVVRRSDQTVAGHRVGVRVAAGDRADRAEPVEPDADDRHVHRHAARRARCGRSPSTGRRTRTCRTPPTVLSIVTRAEERDPVGELHRRPHRERDEPDADDHDDGRRDARRVRLGRARHAGDAGHRHGNRLRRGA